MNPVRISSNIKYVHNVIALAVGCLFWNLSFWIWTQEPETNQFIILFALIGAFLIGISLYSFAKPQTLFFDNQFLYIKERKNTLRVPLSEIVKVKRTSRAVNDVYFWQIDYRDELGQMQDIRFIPRKLNKSFNRFRDKVNQANLQVS